MNKQRCVLLLLFDEVEVLDFAGPFEVFSIAGRDFPVKPFAVSIVANRKELITARNGLKVLPDYSYDDAAQADVLVVPGGYGARTAMKDEGTLQFVRKQANQAERTLSVCTGALILGKAGLLENKAAGTHHLIYDFFEEQVPGARLQRGQRYVDEGRILTSAGISAGIDLALYVVEQLLGLEEALKTASYMEYDWRK